MSDERVRCPGPDGRGCGRALAITTDFCPDCGTVFIGHELWAIYAASVGSA